MPNSEIEGQSLVANIKKYRLKAQTNRIFAAMFFLPIIIFFHLQYAFELARRCDF